jgi:hypothetical protein
VFQGGRGTLWSGSVEMYKGGLVSTKRRENLSLFSTGTVRKGKENLRTTFLFFLTKRRRDKPKE